MRRFFDFLVMIVVVIELGVEFSFEWFFSRIVVFGLFERYWEVVVFSDYKDRFMNIF